MRTKLLFCLSLLLTQCQKKEALESQQEFAVEVQGIGADCGLPILDFEGDLNQLKAISSQQGWSRYYAYQLDSQYWTAGKKLLVKIRSTTNQELSACTAMGPAYPWITITAARPR